MKDKLPGHSYPAKGARKVPDRAELARLVQPATHDGGRRDMPADARRFAARSAARLSRYPDQRGLPNWLLAMVEKQASVGELTQALNERLSRAPSEENLELALLLANEIVRMKGGAVALENQLSPELLQRLSGKGGEAK